MPSPFVRRQRLAAELRTLRERSGMTADELSKLVFRSRTTISKLENARCRPDLGDVSNILSALGVADDEFDEIFTIARQANARGWWDAYGDTMGSRQRLYADIESGAATIREYNQFTIPGVLQTPDFIRFIIEMAIAEGEIDFLPDRLMEARLHRQREFLSLDGPNYEVILDEVVVRRPAAPPRVMLGQLQSLIETATHHPHVTVLVLPLAADFTGRLLPKSAFFLFHFKDPADPPMAVVDTISADIVHTGEDEVARYKQRYGHLRQATLSGAASLGLLIDAADDLENRIGSSP